MPIGAFRWRGAGSHEGLITRELRRVWEAALEVPIDAAPTWIHGDLHARNVLVEGNQITGVTDWGDIRR